MIMSDKHRLAQQVNDYWRERGYLANARVEKRPDPQTGHPKLEIVSDCVNGHPTRRVTRSTSQTETGQPRPKG